MIFGSSYVSDGTSTVCNIYCTLFHLQFSFNFYAASIQLFFVRNTIYST